jgi:hypothetical protein
MQLDMSILKRPHLDVPPDLEACPYFHRKSLKVAGEKWIHW